MDVALNTPLTLSSEQETKAEAQKLASQLKIGDVVALQGNLGAGKTTFTRFLIQALHGEHTEVNSPTFTITQIYDDKEPMIAHYDLYRIDESLDIGELGLDEHLTSAITIIEWPEVALDYLPQQSTLWVNIDFSNTSEIERIITYSTSEPLTKVSKG